MPGQDLNNAVVKSFRRAGATTQYAALVATANNDEVQLPAALNDDKFVGFELYDSVVGDVKSVHLGGGVALAVAAAAFNPGDKLQIANALGQVQKAAPSLSQVDLALAAAANAVTLTKTARGAIAVQVTAGVATGAFQLIPRGVAPTVTKTCSLNAAGTQIVFLATDAVTTASVEYEPLDSPTRIIAKSLGIAAAAGDVVPVVIVHGSVQG